MTKVIKDMTQSNEYRKSIESILLENYVDTDYHTHVSMHPKRGKFQFNRQVLEEFWDCYSSSVLDGNKYGIAEKPQTYMPIIVDVDLTLKINKED